MWSPVSDLPRRARGPECLRDGRTDGRTKSWAGDGAGRVEGGRTGQTEEGEGGWVSRGGGKGGRKTDGLKKGGVDRPQGAERPRIPQSSRQPRGMEGTRDAAGGLPGAERALAPSTRRHASSQGGERSPGAGAGGLGRTLHSSGHASRCKEWKLLRLVETERGTSHWSLSSVTQKGPGLGTAIGGTSFLSCIFLTMSPLH